MTWTKREADAWLEKYTKMRQAGWKRHKDGTWTNPNHGKMHYIYTDVETMMRQLEDSENNE